MTKCRLSSKPLQENLYNNETTHQQNGKNPADDNEDKHQRLEDCQSVQTHKNIFAKLQEEFKFDSPITNSTDENRPTLSMQEVNAQFESKINKGDKKLPLSKPTIEIDKTSELVFPNVRILVQQFDLLVTDLVKSNTTCRALTNSEKLTCEVLMDDENIPVKVKDIRKRFEYTEMNCPQESSDFISKYQNRPSHCDCVNGCDNEIRFKCAKHSPESQDLYEVFKSRCSNSKCAKSTSNCVQCSLELFSLNERNLREKKSVSEINLRNDDPASTFWSRNFLLPTKESFRRRSLTPLSSSSAVSSSGSAENISLSRSLSHELISLSPDWEPHPSSTDIATVIKQESKSDKSSDSSKSPMNVELDSDFSRNFEPNLSLPSINDQYRPNHVPVVCKTPLSPAIAQPSLQTTKSLQQMCKDTEDEVVLRRSSSDNGIERSLRTPSVVISDYSGCISNAYDDFYVNNEVRFSTPEPFLHDDYFFGRKLSECSSLSTDSSRRRRRSSQSDISASELLQRRLSDCSSCSCLTGSEDEVEVEVSLRQPSPPPLRKNSNWRKVRNVVQWTPFIQTYKRHKYPWIQLAGHQGNFRAGYKQGTIMKKLCPSEQRAFETIKTDVIAPFVPEYLGIVEGYDGEKYIQLQDLLSDISSPCVMDIKMGVRTYLEDELAKARNLPKLRKDMYEKMIQIDQKAPTEAENRAKAVTKPRYMVWRETISSTATLGFRIEGLRKGDGTSSKDFKTTRTRDQVMEVLSEFIGGYSNVAMKYILRLKDIKKTLEKSSFFASHELIGSSLLFVHNEEKSGVWLIDFAKSVPLPDGVSVSHAVPWVEGTHEDGYLIGLDNVIDIMEHLRDLSQSAAPTASTSSDKDPQRSEGVSDCENNITNSQSDCVNAQSTNSQSTDCVNKQSDCGNSQSTDCSNSQSIDCDNSQSTDCGNTQSTDCDSKNMPPPTTGKLKSDFNGKVA